MTPLQEENGTGPQAEKDPEEDILALTQQLTVLKNRYAILEKKGLLLSRQLEEAKAQTDRDRSKIEKLAGVIFEKDHRIDDLQQLETSLKRIMEAKQELERSLENRFNECRALKEDKEHLEAEARDRSLHVEQLERVIQFLRERQQEAQLELAQLRDEFQGSQESLQHLQGQLLSSQMQFNQADESLKHTEKEKAEALEDLSLLHVQMDKLKSLIEKHQIENQVEKSRFAALEMANGSKSKENRELKQQLQDKIACLASFEKEILLIKQTLVRALREAKEIEAQYRETVQEKILAVSKIHHFQQQIEKYRETENAGKMELHKAKDRIIHFEALQKELEARMRQQATASTQEVETLKNSLLEKENHVTALQFQLNQKIEEIHLFKNNLSHHQQKQQETESELRAAHQHLAKKVKEMAVLEEKFQSQQRHIEEQEKIHMQDQIKLAEFQTALELQKQQQARQESQFQERLKASDALQSKWEEKYLSLHENCQKTEIKLKELEKTEERYKHLQGLVSNLGTVIGSTSPIPPEKETLSPKETAAAEPSGARSIQQGHKEERVDLAKPYQNLFDMPKSSGKYKQNLID